jgi:D-alanyl-D-alanine carboxypeptidase
MEDTFYLHLINRDYGITGEPDSRLIVPAWPGVPVSANTITLHQTALKAVEELFNLAREAQAGTFYVTSGFRDYETQRQTYNGISDKSLVLPPNHSEHQLGLAVDILAMGVTQAEFGASREGSWLAANAWRYGLLLRYTDEKRHITGIACEPWHFRYVGQPHAWFMRENNLCFEEYIAFLQDSGAYEAELSGKAYYVSYQMPQNNMLYVPENLRYNVSSDNTGGYIVTAWR